MTVRTHSIQTPHDTVAARQHFYPVRDSATMLRRNSGICSATRR